MVQNNLPRYPPELKTTIYLAVVCLWQNAVVIFTTGDVAVARFFSGHMSGRKNNINNICVIMKDGILSNKLTCVQ